MASLACELRRGGLGGPGGPWFILLLLTPQALGWTRKVEAVWPCTCPLPPPGRWPARWARPRLGPMLRACQVHMWTGPHAQAAAGQPVLTPAGLKRETDVVGVSGGAGEISRLKTDGKVLEKGTWSG